MTHLGLPVLIPPEELSETAGDGVEAGFYARS